MVTPKLHNIKTLFCGGLLCAGYVWGDLVSPGGVRDACLPATRKPPTLRRLARQWITRDFFCKARQSGVKPCGNLIRT